MPTCTDCGGTVIEYDAAAGNGFCVRCGTVIEENTIVNEVVFGETSSGAAMVQGSYVAQGASHARMSGPYGNRGGSESREQTIANANKRIQSIAGVLRLSEVVCLAATRLYTLAVEHKFTKGRKALNVVAVCLYVACRQKETRNYMLIDFSDLLQVNVFELGHTYLQLVQTLNLRLPLVDPSHYISRFAALLEFGDETHRVATDAIRLVQRFDRDWMTRGRRPAGICGAALLLAARMNNFRRSVEEIVQVVKIADTTLKKRLDEFKNTPSGSLTLADFRSVWLEEEMDPPAFIKGREKEEADKTTAEDTPEGASPKVKKRKKEKKGKKKGKKRKREDDDEDDDEEKDEEDARQHEANAENGTESPEKQRLSVDPSVFNEGILVGTTEPPPLFLPEQIDEGNIDPALLGQSSSTASISRTANDDSDQPLIAPPLDPFDETVSSALAEEVNNFLEGSQGLQLTDALNDAEQQRLAEMTVVDELTGLDEDELDRLLLSEEEVKIKERVWVELNKEYLEALAAKGDSEQSSSNKRKRRKTASNKPRDMSTPHGATAAESVQNLLKKNPKYSRRINYAALQDLFVDGPAPMNIDDKTDEPLYTMDDKDEGGGMVVIEEAGVVGVNPSPSKSRAPKGIAMEMDEDEDEDAEDEKDDGWEEGYEQEV